MSGFGVISCENRGFVTGFPPETPQKQQRGQPGPAPSENVRYAELSAHARGAMPVTAAGTGAGSGAWLGGQEAFALHLFARELAGPADRFRLLPRLLFRWFFVMAAKLHLAENAFALHLFLQRRQGLVDVVVANENLHACSFVVAANGLRQKTPKTGALSRAALAEKALRVHASSHSLSGQCRQHVSLNRITTDQYYGFRVRKNARQRPRLNQRNPSAVPYPRDMPHFAPGTGLALAVNVHRCSGDREPSGGIVYFGTDQVHHFDAPAQPHRLRQRPARYSPYVLLELRDGRTVDGPVTGIVDARGDLINQHGTPAPFRNHEHFDRKHADIVECLGDPGRNPP